MMDDITNGKY